MARKHAFGFIRRFDRVERPRQRRGKATMFRSLRIESVEARVLLAPIAIDSDGLLDIAVSNYEFSGFAIYLSLGDTVKMNGVDSDHRVTFSDAAASVPPQHVMGTNANFRFGGVGSPLNFSFSLREYDTDSAGIAPAEAGLLSLKMETPPFAYFGPEDGRKTSLPQEPQDLIDIGLVMKTPQRPEPIETDRLASDDRRDIDRTFSRGAGENTQRAPAVDGQYAMLQTFELSGGHFDSVEASHAPADRHSPPPQTEKAPPRRAARAVEGGVTHVTPEIQRLDHIARYAVRSDSPTEAAFNAIESTRDDQRVAASHAPIGHNSHAAVFEEIGGEQAPDLIGPAAYLNLGRNSSIAPAMLAAAGGQLLFGASWRSCRRRVPKPAIERPLRR